MAEKVRLDEPTDEPQVRSTGKEVNVLGKVYLGSAIYSSPIVANGVLYVCSEEYLWALQSRAQATE